MSIISFYSHKHVVSYNTVLQKTCFILILLVFLFLLSWCHLLQELNFTFFLSTNVYNSATVLFSCSFTFIAFTYFLGAYQWPLLFISTCYPKSVLLLSINFGWLDDSWLVDGCLVSWCMAGWWMNRWMKMVDRM